MDSVLPIHQGLPDVEVGQCPHTPTSSPHNLLHSPPRGHGSPSIGRKFADTLRRKFLRSSDPKDESDSSPKLQRRRSIIGLFSATSHKQPEKDICKNECSTERTKTTSPRKSTSDEKFHASQSRVTNNKITAESPSPHLVRRRRSLSNMLGTLSKRVSPKRGSLFGKSQERQETFDVPKIENEETDKVLGPLSIGTLTIQALSQTPDQVASSLSAILEPSQRPVSFAEQLVEIVEDLKEQQLASRRSSDCSSCSWNSHVLTLTSQNGSPNRILRGYNVEEDRPGTPDSYLQLLIDSHSFTNEKTNLGEGEQDELASVSPSKQTPLHTLDSMEAISDEVHTPKRSISNYQIPSIAICKGGSSLEKQLMDSNAGWNDQNEAKSDIEGFLAKKQLLFHCEPHYPISIETGTVLKHELSSLQDAGGRTLIPSFDNDSSQNQRGNHGERHRQIAAKRIELTVARMRKNFHLKDVTDQGSLPQPMGRIDFERDQKAVWDAIMIGCNILYRASRIARLKSFPSDEDISSLSSMKKKKKNKEATHVKDTRSSKKPQYESSNNTIEISLKRHNKLDYPTGKVDVMQESEGFSMPLESHLDDFVTIVPEGPGHFPETNRPKLCPPPIHTTHGIDKEKDDGDRDNLPLERRAEHSDQPKSISVRQYRNRADPQRKSCSGGIIRVEYPSVVGRFAHVKTYDSKEMAIAAMFHYKHCELSEYAIFDPSERTIYARLPENGKPDTEIMNQHGFEVIWLPMNSQLTEKSQHIQYQAVDIGREEQIPAGVLEDELHETESCLSIHRVVKDNYIDAAPISGPFSFKPFINQDKELDLTFNENSFLEVDSKMARSGLSRRYSEQPHNSTRVHEPLPKKDHISKTQFNSETLHWEGKEEIISSALTWAELDNVHQSEVSRTGLSSESYREVQHNSSIDTSRRMQGQLRRPSVRLCPVTGLFMELYKVEGEKYGFCLGCSAKIHIRRQSSKQDHSHHIICSDLNLNNSTRGLNKIEVSESELADDESSVVGDIRSASADSIGNGRTPGCVFEERENMSSGQYYRDTVISHMLTKPEKVQVSAHCTQSESFPEMNGEVLLPMISSTNGRDFALVVPAESSFSWASFMDGDLDGLNPFFGRRSTESSSDEISMSDTSIPKILAHSNSLLPPEDEPQIINDINSTGFGETISGQSSSSSDGKNTEIATSIVECENHHVTATKAGMVHKSGMVESIHPRDGNCLNVTKIQTQEGYCPTRESLVSDKRGISRDRLRSKKVEIAETIQSSSVHRSSDFVDNKVLSFEQDFTAKSITERDLPDLDLKAFGISRKVDGSFSITISEVLEQSTPSHSAEAATRCNKKKDVQEVSRVSSTVSSRVTLPGGWKFSRYTDRLGSSSYRADSSGTSSSGSLTESSDGSYEADSSLLSGFKFSRYRDLLPENTDEASITATDQDSKEDDQLSTKSVILSMTDQLGTQDRLRESTDGLDQWIKESVENLIPSPDLLQPQSTQIRLFYETLQIAEDSLQTAMRYFSAEDGTQQQPQASQPSRPVGQEGYHIVNPEHSSSSAEATQPDPTSFIENRLSCHFGVENDSTLSSTESYIDPVTSSTQAHTAKRLYMTKLNKVGALVEILQARGSLGHGFGSSKASHGFSRNGNRFSQPRKTQDAMPVTYSTKPSLGISDLDTDVSDSGEPLEPAPRREGKEVEAFREIVSQVENLQRPL